MLGTKSFRKQISTKSKNNTKKNLFHFNRKKKSRKKSRDRNRRKPRNTINLCNDSHVYTNIIPIQRKHNSSVRSNYSQHPNILNNFVMNNTNFNNRNNSSSASNNNHNNFAARNSNSNMAVNNNHNVLMYLFFQSNF